MHNAFMLTSGVRVAAKLQILIVMTFLKLAQLTVHRFCELICVRQQSLTSEFKDALDVSMTIIMTKT